MFAFKSIVDFTMENKYQRMLYNCHCSIIELWKPSSECIQKSFWMLLFLEIMVQKVLSVFLFLFLCSAIFTLIGLFVVSPTATNDNENHRMSITIMTTCTASHPLGWHESLFYIHDNPDAENCKNPAILDAGRELSLLITWHVLGINTKVQNLYKTDLAWSDEDLRTGGQECRILLNLWSILSLFYLYFEWGG